MSTIATFCRKYNIRADAVMVDSNPHITDMPAGSAHYRVTLKRPGRQMTVFYSMGPALCREPSASEVLSCLISDATSFDNARDFDDWCSNYGYDTDSRKAERIYKTVEAQAGKLKSFLGHLYNAACQCEPE